MQVCANNYYYTRAQVRTLLAFIGSVLFVFYLTIWRFGVVIQRNNTDQQQQQTFFADHTFFHDSSRQKNLQDSANKMQRLSQVVQPRKQVPFVLADKERQFNSLIQTARNLMPTPQSAAESVEFNVTTTTTTNEQPSTSFKTSTGSDLSLEESFIYLTMINAAYADLTLNWLCNIQNFTGVLDRTLVICTDNSTCGYLRKHWPRLNCVTLRFRSAENSGLTWGDTGYVSFLTVRAEVLSVLVSAGVPLVLFETDAIWFRDPSTYFQQTIVDGQSAADITLPIKGYPDHGLTLTFDPMLIRPTEGSRRFFTELSRRLTDNPDLYDQDVLDGMCKVQYWGVFCDTFPWSDVADGKWFKLSAVDRNTLRPLIVNNNYYVGVDNKISRQALNGFWFLNHQKLCDPRKVQKGLNQKYR